MPKVFITDEINDGYTADVLPSGAIKTANEHTYAYLNSAAGTGVISTGNIILHKIIVGASANSALLYIGQNATSAAGAPNNTTSASTVARIDLAQRQIYDLDAYIGAVSTYRLSGANSDGIVITYEVR